MPDLLFWFFAALLLLAGLGVVLSPQPIHSILWMFAVVLSSSGIMAYLGAYMLSVITLLVYAGAILVLFAFIIMFIGQRAPQKKIGRWRLLAALGAVVVTVVAVIPVAGGHLLSNQLPVATTIADNTAFGTQLYARYPLLAMLAGWLLLWASVGAFNIVSLSDNPKRATVAQEGK